jgi:hypothetical protein
MTEGATRLTYIAETDPHQRLHYRKFRGSHAVDFREIRSGSSFVTKSSPEQTTSVERIPDENRAYRGVSAEFFRNLERAWRKQQPGALNV